MPKETVAVLGLGPMGRALATALLRAHHPTVIWNRTASRGGPLVDRGASPAPHPAEAVRRASVVICCVLDHRALASVLAEVDDWSGTVLVNLTSGHAGEARDMAAWAAERSLPYLDGAILTPAPTIGTPAASILYSGPESLFERIRPVSASLAPNTRFVGTDPGAAAGYEIALLDLFATAVGGVAHAFALAAAEKIEPRAFAPLARGIGGLLTDQIDRFAEQLTEGRFPAPISNLASMSSTMEHLIEATAASGLDDGPLRALATIVGRAIAAGHGDQGYARLTGAMSE
ncbi:6-phosphogluconate dehydrogenase [Actinoplanes ianthinogenes]|uniref:6-phosphogluconate dehydrogenase n=1 Tax=Actinoplanes ianthinogenes TaxID=122358 RepID=A0ABN6CP30_9ACTN|nr:6-phosphogluconate dehydrogenase [Actinoplanes ianthinogenes]GGR14220.1 6-phosphogluconate dehydrogenase [Actinoplanes ianthinogenes]